MNTTGSLIFYTHPLAFNPAKPAVVIAEKKIPCTIRKVDILGGGSLQPWFMAKNPNAAVPVLEHGGKVILESLTICKYLDQLDGQPLGGDRVDRAWIDIFIQELDGFDGNLWAFAHMPSNIQGTMASLGAYRNQLAASLAKKHPNLKDAYEAKLASMKQTSADNKDEAKIADCETRLAKLFNTAEMRLSAQGEPTADGGPFLGGPEYSIADAMFAPILYRVTAFGGHKQHIAGRAALSAYMRRMRERPSWKAAFGANDSTWGKLSWVVPAIIKSKLHWGV